MFILNWIKSPRYFYASIAVIFVIFALTIMLTGRLVYVNETERMLGNKVSELTNARTQLENRLGELELELRRISNLLEQQGILDASNPLEIQQFVSDFLFDHYYISVILKVNSSEYTRIDSLNITNKYDSFVNLPCEAVFNKIYTDSTQNRLTISKELNLIYMVKNIQNNRGEKDKSIAFFFTPELLLSHIPQSYGLLFGNGTLEWFASNIDTLSQIPLPDQIAADGINTMSDTMSMYTAPLGTGEGLYLALVSDTSDIKRTLIASTFITLMIFTLFFFLLFSLIYTRNIQVSQLIDTQKATVVCLANLAEFKDNETSDHLERTRHYGSLLSEYLRDNSHYSGQITRDYMDNIGFSSVLHDIGKVGVPDQILKKPAQLSPDEFEIIKKHTTHAKEILRDLVDKYNVNDIFFSLAYNIAVYHHEKWDGTGYPDGLSGEDIPLEARIFAVCDVYDALRSERVYKQPYSHEKTMGIIAEGRGTHFDPLVVDALTACEDQFKKIHNTYDIFYKDVQYSSFGNNRRELKIEWNESLSVGIREIDIQHKILFSKINDLIKAVMNGKGDQSILNLLKFLEKYIGEHFQTEESIMESINYPRAEEHKATHEMFRKRLDETLKKVSCEGVSEETFAYIEKDLVTWLLRHILEMDMDMAQTIKST